MSCCTFASCPAAAAWVPPSTRTAAAASAASVRLLGGVEAPRGAASQLSGVVLVATARRAARWSVTRSSKGSATYRVVSHARIVETVRIPAAATGSTRRASVVRSQKIRIGQCQRYSA